MSFLDVKHKRLQQVAAGDGFQSRKNLYPVPLNNMKAKQAVLPYCAIGTDHPELY